MSRTQGEQRSAGVVGARNLGRAIIELLVSEGQQVESGAVLARSAGEGSDLPVTQIVARLPGRITIDRSNRVSILYEEREEREDDEAPADGVGRG